MRGGIDGGRDGFSVACASDGDERGSLVELYRAWVLKRTLQGIGIAFLAVALVIGADVWIASGEAPGPAPAGAAAP